MPADLHHRQTGKGFKGKIKPPRLNGERRGALATRTPHRPNPIGLSLCKVISVQDGCLVLGGADLVDGTPVLDIKPYVPFCEALPNARAPHWVTVRSAALCAFELPRTWQTPTVPARLVTGTLIGHHDVELVQDDADKEPLKVSDVCISAAAQDQLHDCWQKLPQRMTTLAPTFEAVTEFVREVLSLDFRSLHQRVQDDSDTIYNVELFGLQLSYHASQGAIKLNKVRCAHVVWHHAGSRCVWQCPLYQSITHVRGLADLSCKTSRIASTTSNIRITRV